MPLAYEMSPLCTSSGLASWGSSAILARRPLVVFVADNQSAVSMKVVSSPGFPMSAMAKRFTVTLWPGALVNVRSAENPSSTEYSPKGAQTID